MTFQSSGLDYYSRMQELEERLRRSEDERMLLQRQFDHLLQTNHEKERARVSAVEARYKRFLDEDKRRRDRNSSLLQALDRIDSHTASLAAKTERMRALRKHYEAFLAHTYPGWHSGIERSYCPRAAIAPTPNAMTRVTDVTDYDTGNLQCFPDPIDYSETQYHSLPSKPLLPLASSLCRSELSLSSRDNFPGAGRSPYRTGSAAIRSASLSPSRVRELASVHNMGKTITPSPRQYDVYSRSRSPDFSLSARLKHEPFTSKEANLMVSPRPSRYHSDGLLSTGGEKINSYRAIPSTNHQFMDYNHGNSDLEVDQNTSGDLLNLSNLSLSDDCILNDTEYPESPLPYSGASHRSYSPRDFGSARKSLSISSPSYESVRHIVSPREVFVPKKSGLSSTILLNTPKSILSPRSRKTDLPSSLPLSDSMHRILLPSESLDISLSPRRQKPSWQTFRPSYLQQQPPRSSMRRSVTFIEPEFENPYIFRDDDVGLYSGSYGSLKRHPTITPSSSWESSDHERYLRDKHGREKDAFREKIERLKELIQENKVDDVSVNDANFDKTKRASSPRFKMEDVSSEDKTSRENSLDREWKVSKSRRSSLAKDFSSDNEDLQRSQISGSSEKKYVRDVSLDGAGEDSFSEPMSDKEQWSGQFSEKEEDMSENDALPADSESLKQDVDCRKLKINESSELDLKEDTSFKELDQHENKEKLQNQQPAANYSNYPTQEQQQENQEALIQEQVKDSADFSQGEAQQPQNMTAQDILAEGSSQFNYSPNFEQTNELNQGKEDTPNFQNELQSVQEDQKKYEDHDTSSNNENQQQQQDWSGNEEDGSQRVQYSFEQGDVPSSNYEQQDQGKSQDSGLEHYPTTGEADQQEYENYQSNAQQQQAQGEYVDAAPYKSYAEPQQPEDSGSTYQTYSEDPNQYQQSYQAYPENQQYEEQQDQNYTTQDQSNFQYPQDPSKAQYEYDAQDYNYQQGQESYEYSQAPNTYQQDPAYQQDQTYSQDQSYQPEQSYAQDPNYQQNENYEHTGDYQPDQTYPGTEYEGSQQYGNYQPKADDLSEDTSQSVDSNYQGQLKGDEAINPKKLEEYRALLGADPNSEPAYSDSSELENQMAAVVGETGNSTKGPVEPQLTTPPPSTPPVASGTSKGKVGAKKKPQLTRKQSSISSDNADGKQQQQASNLPKVPESGASQH